MAKSYGQFCGLARALDRVGDRWTLLIVRELLVRDATYGELQASLEGIATNLLADRLRGLESDGLVARERSRSDRRRVAYSLTPLGRGLEPAVAALIVWGANWMQDGPGDDRFEPRWAALALRALLAHRAGPLAGTVEFRYEDGSVRISAPGGPSRLAAPAASEPESDLTVEGPASLLLALASGQVDLADAERQGVRVLGDRSIAEAFLPS